jgi:hypothetical protein
MASQRDQLLQDLQKTTKEYVAKERTRLQNEAAVMKAVLKGRTGGRGLQDQNTQVAAAVAQANLSKYLGQA